MSFSGHELVLQEPNQKILEMLLHVLSGHWLS